MKILATLVLAAALAIPAGAAVVHDEAANGDLSSDPGAPTALAFVPGANTVAGTVRTPADTRDYITFTIPAGQKLLALNLAFYSPSNISFAAFNAGTTSFIPDITTDPMFLSGIHVSGDLFGSDLMPQFVTNNVTSNALVDPWLTGGTYCFMIQQANTNLTTYRLDFVVDGTVPVGTDTWGAIKSLYR